MKRKIMSIVGVLVTIISVGTFASASTTIVLPLYAGYRTDVSTVRSGNYSYVEERLNSVYPSNGGTDYYSSVSAGIYNQSGQAISNQYVLDETSGSYTKMYVLEGYLATTNIKLGHMNMYSGHSLSANIDFDPK